jgi:hypothetical protein
MTIEDVKVIIQGDETRTLENWGSGVGRMVDACKNANLPEPEFNQNAAFLGRFVKPCCYGLVVQMRCIM